MLILYGISQQILREEFELVMEWISVKFVPRFCNEK
jgi:hypothetical protein